MPVTFTAGNAAVSALATDLIRSALLELGVFSPEETIPAPDAAWGLEKLQRLIDQFNAREELIYNVNFTKYSLIPNHQPHTIGPGGDFDVPLRPVQLVSAALVLTSSSPNVEFPLPVWDDQQWAAVQIKDLASTLPTAVYYSPDTPKGQLFFWPIPQAANAVRLETWVNLTQAVNLQTAIAMPVGYWEALVLSLATKLASSYKVPVDALLLENYKLAMKAIEGNNAESPRINTRAAGMPGARPSFRPGFNFLTGQPW